MAKDNWDDREVAADGDFLDGFVDSEPFVPPSARQAGSTLTDPATRTRSGVNGSPILDLTEDADPYGRPVNRAADFGDPAAFFVAPSPKELLTERSGKTSARKKARPTASGAGAAAPPPKPSTASSRPHREMSNGRKAALFLAPVLLGVVAVVWVSVTSMAGGGDDAAQAAPLARTSVRASTVAPSTTAAPVDRCATATSPDGVFTTHGPGDRMSPQMLIADLQYAYYVKRDAQLAISHYDPSLRMDIAAMQAAIAGVPANTTYCLKVGPSDVANAFTVDLTETRPDGGTTVFPQTVVVTKTSDGTYLVTSVVTR